MILKIDWINTLQQENIDQLFRIDEFYVFQKTCARVHEERNWVKFMSIVVHLLKFIKKKKNCEWRTAAR